jgi:Putative DNA-binding domain
MLFRATPRNVEDIRSFCAQFNEGIRVEYKSTFDDNVRRALPKVVSSFANSLGGVLVIGVNALDGVPQNPIEGFAPPAEELPLTVENFCIRGINPPVFPKTTVINSDVEGHVFLVIEVDESWEAPHAIENSRKVYVRTGNAANPYDLAQVDLVIELVRRRAEPLALRNRLLERARQRAVQAVADTSLHVEVSISPLYPRRSLSTRDATWDFLSTESYRGGRFFPFETLRRVEDGTASFRLNEQYGELNTFGVILGRQVMQPGQEQQLLVGDPFQLMLRLLVCANRFFRSVGYRGDVGINLTLRNMQNQRMVFIPIRPGTVLGENDYRSFENVIFGAANRRC